MLFFSFGAREIRSVFPIEENFQVHKEQKLCSDYRDYLCEGCVSHLVSKFDDRGAVALSCF